MAAPNGIHWRPSLLTLNGHTTTAVYSACDAIDRARSFRADAARLDIGLPQMSGYELAAKVRQLMRLLQIVAVSGYAQEEDIGRVTPAGFDEHAVKTGYCY